jgi:hypothetical protein
MLWSIAADRLGAGIAEVLAAQRFALDHTTL